MKLSNWLFFAVLLFSSYIFAKDATQETDGEGSSKETFEFSADIHRMMNIIIHSLYQNKEIFLRELMANANDAIGKLRILSLQNPSVKVDENNLGIWVHFDKNESTITIKDTGLGMTREHLKANLGTIAKSGTSDFMALLEKNMEKGKLKLKDIQNQIGQFGVGFYSSFLVADKVTVHSKHDDDPEHNVWESDSRIFNISKYQGDDLFARGTSITLHLKPEAVDYLKTEKLQELVTKYGSFLDVPIYVWGKVTKTIPDEENEEEDKKETDDLEDEKEPEEKKKDKTITVDDYILVNSVKPIWTRDSSEVKDEEYLEFYRSLTNKPNSNYLAKIHFNVEGEVQFKACVFIPEEAPSGFMNHKTEGKATNYLKLYVRRVFIKSATETFLPGYLAFIYGVVDSDDFPLNVGRENLQHTELSKVIKRKLERKVIDAIRKLDEVSFAKFYKVYGDTIKIGVINDYSNRDKLMKILRFKSSAFSKKENTTLEAYVGRMKKGQKQILFHSCEKFKSCIKSPYVTDLSKRGYEVLFMTEPIDEYLLSQVSEFEGIKFHEVSKSGLDLKSNIDEEIKKEMEIKYKPLFDYLLDKSVVKSKIITANVSFDTDNSCLFLSTEEGLTGKMERVYLSQATKSKDEVDHIKRLSNMGKHLKINPYHPLSELMLQMVEDENEGEVLEQLTRNCIAIAELFGGFTLENPHYLANILQNTTLKSIGKDPAEVKILIEEQLKQAIINENEETEDSEKTEGSEEDAETKDDVDEKEQKLEL